MLINICFGFMMFVVSLVEFSKHVQNEISAKVMPKAQNFTADFADRTDRRNYDPPKTPNSAERTTGPRSEVSAVQDADQLNPKLTCCGLADYPLLPWLKQKGSLSSKRGA